jgi:putative acetyltransferase
MSDASDLHEIRSSEGSRENTLGLITNKVMRTEKILANLNENDHLLVAEVDGKVVGSAGLKVNQSPRMNHVASFGIGLHPDYQDKGIGSMLIREILDLADNWLMLIRVELDVFEDNERAIHLYKKYGFVVEGKKKYATKRFGKYDTEILMARYNEKLLGGMKNEENNGE